MHHHTPALDWPKVYLDAGHVLSVTEGLGLDLIREHLTHGYGVPADDATAEDLGLRHLQLHADHARALHGEA